MLSFRTFHGLLLFTFWTDFLPSFLGLLQSGRTAEAEAEFEKLLGGAHVNYAYAELSKSDRGDDAGEVKLSELLHGRHFKGNVQCKHWSVNSFHILLTLYETFFFLSKLLHLHVKFCSGFHWFNPFCFTAALWHKCCFLFLFHRLQKFWCTFRLCKYMYRSSKPSRYVCSHRIIFQFSYEIMLVYAFYFFSSFRVNCCNDTDG